MWAFGSDTLGNLVPWIDDKLYYIVLYDYPPRRSYNFALYKFKLWYFNFCLLPAERIKPIGTTWSDFHDNRKIYFN